MNIKASNIVVMPLTMPEYDVMGFLNNPTTLTEGRKTACLLSGYTESDFHTLEKYSPHLDKVLSLLDVTKPVYTAKIGLEYNKSHVRLLLEDTGTGTFNFYPNTAQHPSIYPPVEVGSYVFYQERGMNGIKLVYDEVPLFQNYYDSTFFDKDSMEAFQQGCKTSGEVRRYLEDTRKYAPVYLEGITRGYDYVRVCYINLFSTKYNKKNGFHRVDSDIRITLTEDTPKFLQEIGKNIAPLLMVSEGKKVRILY